jgi:ATP-dependent Zn protease
MKKFISYSIPIITLTVFVLIMLSGNHFKKPRNSSEDVISFTQTSIEHAKAEKWDMLNQDITSIDSAWEKIIPRIQFSVERNEIYNISLNIARLRGSIASEDKASTLIALYEIIEDWDELSR